MLMAIPAQVFGNLAKRMAELTENTRVSQSAMEDCQPCLSSSAPYNKVAQVK